MAYFPLNVGRGPAPAHWSEHKKHSYYCIDYTEAPCTQEVSVTSTARTLSTYLAEAYRSINLHKYKPAGMLCLYRLWCKVSMYSNTSRFSFTLLFHSFSPITCFSFHYLMCIDCLHFICFFFAWVLSTVIEAHSVFFSFPSFSPTHQQAASQSKAQKKLQPLTQVPVLQEQGEYCAGVGGVWTWVPAVWRRGVFFFSSFPLHASVLSLNSHFSAHLRGWFVWRHHSHPFLTVPERYSTCWASIRLEMWGSLWCVCTCLRAPEECVAVCAASCLCVRKFSAALTHMLSNTVMLRLV